MTLNEYAIIRGVTVQSVYKRLKGVTSVADITDKKHKLTPEGLELLKSLYDDPVPEEEPGEDPGEDPKEEQTKDDSQEKKEREEIERLEALVSELKIQIEDLKTERDRWAEMARQSAQTAQQAQALHMASIKALDEPKKRQPLFKRLLNGIKGKEPKE